MKLQAKIKTRAWVAHVDDERALGNGVIVTLAKSYCFTDDPGCGVRGFDTMTQAERETRLEYVYEEVAADGN